MAPRDVEFHGMTSESLNDGESPPRAGRGPEGALEPSRAFHPGDWLIQEGPDVVASILDTIAESLVVLDQRLTIRHANRAFRETCPADTTNVKECSFFEISEGRWNVPGVRSLVEGLLTRGGHVKSERITIDSPRDGHRVIVINARLIPAARSGEARMVLAINDVTDLAEAEKARADRGIRLQAVLDTAADGIVTIDERGTILTFNNAAEKMFDYRSDEVVGRNVKVLMLPTDAHSHDSHLANYLATGVKKIIGVGREVTGLRKDGVTFPIHLAVSEANTDPRIFTGILRDVTELKEAQRRALLTGRLAAIGEVSAGLSHESRNALQRSQACLEMLAMIVKDQPDALSLVTRVQHAQDHLLELYEGVREYAGDIHLSREPCDLRSLMDEVWRRLSEDHKDRDVTFVSEPSAVEVDCMVDRTGLKQVFENVLLNALQACTDPVQITVTWSEWEPTSPRGRSKLRIAIRNDGPPVSPGDRAKIFDAFYTTKTRGTGLGLAISRRILEAHGGQIALGDPTDWGAEFVITLPRGDP